MKIQQGFDSVRNIELGAGKNHVQNTSSGFRSIRGLLSEEVRESGFRKEPALEKEDARELVCGG